MGANERWDEASPATAGARQEAPIHRNDSMLIECQIAPLRAEWRSEGYRKMAIFAGFASPFPIHGPGATLAVPLCSIEVRQQSPC